MIKKFLKDESGATAIEYALIAAATALVLVAVGQQLRDSLSGLFGQITEGLQNSGG
jgi:pilus assembly protein Flp/PilA